MDVQEQDALLSAGLVRLRCGGLPATYECRATVNGRRMVIARPGTDYRAAVAAMASVPVPPRGKPKKPYNETESASHANEGQAARTAAAFIRAHHHGTAEQGADTSVETNFARGTRNSHSPVGPSTFVENLIQGGLDPNCAGAHELVHFRHSHVDIAPLFRRGRLSAMECTPLLNTLGAGLLQVALLASD